MNRNGFILTDVLIAVIFMMLFICPVLYVSSKAVNLYMAAKEIREAAMYGRFYMEFSRDRATHSEDFQEKRGEEGAQYLIKGVRCDLDDDYYRQDIEVQTPHGKIFMFKRLARQIKD